MDFVNCEVFPQKLLVVSKLDYQRNIERVLQQSVNPLTSSVISLLAQDRYSFVILNLIKLLLLEFFLIL